MTRSKDKLLFFGVVLVAAIATSLVLQQMRMREKNRVLREQLEGFAELAAANERMSNLLNHALGAGTELDDLLRLRSEAALLRQQNQDLKELQEENRRLRVEKQESSRGGVSNTPPVEQAGYSGDRQREITVTSYDVKTNSIRVEPPASPQMYVTFYFEDRVKAEMKERYVNGHASRVIILDNGAEVARGTAWASLSDQDQFGLYVVFDTLEQRQRASRCLKIRKE